jgi:hypothetical protein
MFIRSALMNLLNDAWDAKEKELEENKGLSGETLIQKTRPDLLHGTISRLDGEYKVK